MLKKILITVAALIAVLVAVIATRPASFTVERTVTIDAPAEQVFAWVSDFQRFEEFSPWAHLDPSMAREVKGTAGMEGHSYGWSGNEKAGEGRMTVTEVVPNQSVSIRLEFLKPFSSTNQNRWTLVGEGEQTQVTWAMVGNLDFMGKAFSLMFDFGESVGGDFDAGLRKLKELVEARGRAEDALVEADAE
jgi:uncharacterized protein YndB with AHSA1/START domain